MDRKKDYNIVLIGGGTGTSQLLRGLKEYSDLALSVITTTADSGGSSGTLRDEIGMPPPGDVRQCFVALNEEAHPFVDLFNVRFSKGALRGHPLGNLFFALLFQKYQDFPKAIRVAEQMVNAEHHIIPVTHAATNLVAQMESGEMVSGEQNITQIWRLQKRLRNLEIEPKRIRINREAKSAIVDADVIIIGPGNVVASLTPPLLIDSLASAVRESSAKKVFVVNLINQKNITEGFEVEDYLFYFDYVMGMNIFNYVIYNTGTISQERLDALGSDEEVVPAFSFREGISYIGRALVSPKNVSADKNDPLGRTLIKHDEKKIAQILYERIITQ